MSPVNKLASRSDHQNAVAVLVFTEESVTSILQNNGCGYWILNRRKASQCQYVICCRKDNLENHRKKLSPKAAFLVGRISGFEEFDEANSRGQQRYLIKCSEFAVLEQPNVWGSGRNPVAYVPVAQTGIAINHLTFKATRDFLQDGSKSQPLTIADAKLGLSKTYGVDPENIEIIIRG